jgi:hypothetical protein
VGRPLGSRHELTPQQHAVLQARNGLHEHQQKARRANIEKWRAVRRRCQEEGRRRARLRDPIYAAGCMLYWAEGGKTPNQVRLSNSDPEVIRFFVTFLRRYFGVTDDRICVYCNLFVDHEARQREIEDFSLDVASVDRCSLRKSTINRYSKYSQKKRKNKLAYGTCRVVVSDVRILQTILGSIQ